MTTFQQRVGFGSQGIPNRKTHKVLPDLENVITGDIPALSTLSFPVEKSTEMKGLTVVALTGAGRLVQGGFAASPSTYATGTITVTGNNPTANVDIGNGAQMTRYTGGADFTGAAGTSASQKAEGASNLAAAMNADIDGPVWAVANDDVVTLTSRAPGSSANLALSNNTGYQRNANNMSGGSGPNVPIGVLAYDVDTGSDDELEFADVYVSGTFNPDRLIWNSDVASLAQRRMAFQHAPAFSRVFIRAIQASTVG